MGSTKNGLNIQQLKTMDSKDFFSKEDIYNDVLLYSYQNPVKHIDDYACESWNRFFRSLWIQERRLDVICRMRAENGTNSTLNMEKKMCLKMRHELGNPFPDGECFLAEMIKTMPPLAGHKLLRIFIGISPAKYDENE